MLKPNTLAVPEEVPPIVLPPTLSSTPTVFPTFAPLALVPKTLPMTTSLVECPVVSTPAVVLKPKTLAAPADVPPIVLPARVWSSTPTELPTFAPLPLVPKDSR